MLFPALRAHGFNPPNPLVLAERVPRPQAVEGVLCPHSVESVSSLRPTGFTRRSKPSVLPPIVYRGFAVAPITLRTLSKTLARSPITLRSLRRHLLVPHSPVPPPQRPPSSREGDRPQAVEGVPLPHSVEGVPPSHPAYSEPFSRIALSTPSLLRYPSISRITVSGGSGVPASAQILTACIRNSLSL